MKNFLFASFVIFFLTLSICADDGKVCYVKDGSVQAEITNSSVPKATSNSRIWEYEVSFAIMNSSPNFVNVTYVIKDTMGNNYSQGRILVEPQKEIQKKVTVKTNSTKSIFVVDVIGADCKEDK